MISVRLPTEADRELLLEWRNRDAVREVSHNQDFITLEQHEGWFARLLSDRQGQLGVVSHDQRPVGVIQLDQLDLEASQATWGCHLGETDVPPGFGATLPILGIALGLRGWKLAQLNAEVKSTNKNMLGVHRRLKIRRVEVAETPGDAESAEPEVHAVQFQVVPDELPSIMERAERLFPKTLAASLADAVDALDSWRTS